MTRELYEDPLNLPGKLPGDKIKPSISKRGHQMKLNMAKANLARLQALYQASCNDPEPPKKPNWCPTPILTGMPPEMNPKTAAAVAAGAGLILAPEITIPAMAIP